MLHRGRPWAAGEQPASPWSSSRAARENSLLRCLTPVNHSLVPVANLSMCVFYASLKYPTELLSDLKFTNMTFVL